MIAQMYLLIWKVHSILSVKSKIKVICRNISLAGRALCQNVKMMGDGVADNLQFSVFPFSFCLFISF